MTQSVEVHLSFENASDGWQDDALVSIKAEALVIHSSVENLVRVRQAARQLAGMGLSALELVGENWGLEHQWAFYLGFNQPGQRVSIQWHTLSEAEQQEFERRLACYDWAKGIINETPETLAPEDLALGAQAFLLSTADKERFDTKILVGDELMSEGYVGVYNVGRGSTRPPVMLQLTYTPEGKESDAPDIALVGKGITFDSGGYSIKSSEGMFSMKCDMAGAATLAAAMALAIRRGLDKKVVLILCCAENLISGNAYKLGDILTYKNGTTVEIANTDAEGRLVMADGLIAASALRPGLIIDAATLTGAAMIAVGTDYNAIFSKDDALLDQALGLAKACNEKTWPLPLDASHAFKCPSQFADTANSNTVKGGGAGGSSNAAGFLSRFVDDECPWIHWDLAAAYNAKPDALSGAGASGQGIAAIAALIAAKA